MSDFDEQRKTGIGGSDAAAAVGISPWRTPYDVWLEKTGEGEPRAVTEPMRWGSLLEPVILAEYADRTGYGIAQLGMLRHPAHHWMIGHVDGIITDENRIVEVKTSRDARGWGEPGTDEVPLHYLVQCQHYLVLAQADIADIAVLIGGSDFRIYQVRADDSIASMLIDQEAAFWEFVERREPPPLVNLRDVVRRWGRLAVQGAVVADRVELLAVEELRRIADHRKTLDEMEEVNKAVVCQGLADKGEALVDDRGDLLCTWKLDSGRKAYTVAAREPARRFLLK